MTTHGHTRQAAFRAACQLTAAGQCPTVASVRSALGGAGGQLQVQQGIKDWMDEATLRFRVPSVPEVLHAPLLAVWEAACQNSNERWAAERAVFADRVSALDAQVARLHEDLRVEREGALALAAARDALAKDLATTRDTRDVARANAEASAAEAQELRAGIAQARAEATEQTRQREHAERVVQEARESLARAQERIARLSADLEIASARESLLEQAAADAKALAALARGDLETAQGEIRDLRTRLAERDGQLAGLTATVQAEQKARDADTEHWLARLAEHQAAVAAAKEREATLIEEKKALSADNQRLRASMRRAAAVSAPVGASSAPG